MSADARVFRCGCVLSHGRLICCPSHTQVVLTVREHCQRRGCINPVPAGRIKYCSRQCCVAAHSQRTNRKPERQEYQRQRHLARKATA